jgi:hypothetical protein
MRPPAKRSFTLYLSIARDRDLWRRQYRRISHPRLLYFIAARLGVTRTGGLNGLVRASSH